MLRAHRLKWLGHILRMDKRRLIHQAVRHMSDHRTTGDLLMDVPTRYSWAELKELAANRDYWRIRVKVLREGSGVSVTMRGPPPSPCKRLISVKHPQNASDQSSMTHQTQFYVVLH